MDFVRILFVFTYLITPMMNFSNHKNSFYLLHKTFCVFKSVFYP